MINLKINSFIIGLGKVGLGYDLKLNNKCLTHYKYLSNSNYFRLVAVSDLDITKKKFLNKKINFYKSYKYGILKHKPKLVVISVKTKDHLKILNFLKNLKFIKYIVCEKPCTNSLKEINSLCDYNLKRKIVVNYIRNYLPLTKHILNYTKKDSEINFIVNYNKSLKNNCSHFIALFLKYFGKPKYLKKFKKYFIFEYDGKFIKFKRIHTGDNSINISNKRYDIKIFDNWSKLKVKVNNKIFFSQNIEIDYYQYFFYKDLYSKILKKNNFSNFELALDTHIIMDSLNNESY